MASVAFGGLQPPSAYGYGHEAGGLYPPWAVGPILAGPIPAQREAYVDLWCSCQIGDAYIDLSIHLFDTYTSKVNAAPPLNPNPTPRDDRTQSLPYMGLACPRAEEA